MSATEQQVGGDHYRTMAVQPEAFIHANGIGFHEGNAIKYLCRWRKRGGLQDLEKARHYIDLLIHHETPAVVAEVMDYHNPDRLESAGEGYRFCLKTEMEHDATHWWTGMEWSDGRLYWNQPLSSGASYRTNKPLPTS